MVIVIGAHSGTAADGRDRDAGRRGGPIRDRTGERYGRLVVVASAGRCSDGSVAWECLCDCGNVAVVRGSNPTGGQTSSCGCLARERSSERAHRPGGIGSVRDLVGQRFGRLVVVRDTGRRVGNNVVWLCRCDCGGEREVQRSHLVSGGARSCGCHRRRDVSGQRFGRLVALRPTGESRGGRAVWLCACDCGREHETLLDYLTGGNTRSCGCLRREVAAEHMRRLRAEREPLALTLDPEASAVARRHAQSAGVAAEEAVRRAVVALGEPGATAEPAAPSREGSEVAGAPCTEVRDGRVFTVTVLPEAKPRANRSARTPWHPGGVDLARAMRRFDAEERRAKAHRPRRSVGT